MAKTSQNLLAHDVFDQDNHSERVLQTYFESLNAADFKTTAALFAEDGQLTPPFENAIAGQVQILAYLEQEAKGLELQPQRLECLPNPSAPHCDRYQVIGVVKTALFSVNVGWEFTLNQTAKIQAVQVILFADLQELLQLNQHQSASV